MIKVISLLVELFKGRLIFSLRNMKGILKTGVKKLNQDRYQFACRKIPISTLIAYGNNNISTNISSKHELKSHLLSWDFSQELKNNEKEVVKIVKKVEMVIKVLYLYYFFKK